MIHNTIIAKLFNCNWSERNKNKPSDSIELTVYTDKNDGELILLELSRKGKPITHITLSKKQLVAVIEMNNSIK